MTDTKIMTFISYKNLFSHIERSGILVPIGSLKNDADLESLIDNIIKNFDNHEAVSYSSFLNAIVQTHDAEETEKMGLGEIKKAQLVKNPPDSGIIFHRDNLLFIIAKLFSKERGDQKITGQKTFKNAQDYYKALLLTSQLIHDSCLEKDHFIRAYPYYYIPQTAANIYEIRLQRYWYIYSNLLAKIEVSKKTHLQKGIQEIETKANLSLKDYFNVVTMIFYWFLKIPNFKKASNDESFKQLGFEPKNLGTFYIRKNNFGEDHDLLKLISYLALDLDGFKMKLANNHGRKYQIQGFYKDFQTIFDHPIFKINDEDFCIIDLKFLFEGLCSGFMWHIKSFSGSNMQSIKEQYGYLLELYFVELLKKIFGETHVHKPIEDGSPDIVLETEKYVIILEFTTEYYLFASLYAEQTDSLKDDLHRLLFNQGKQDPKARDKDETGKFFKLNGYLEKYKDSKKTILPILVTENYLGDFDLLNRFDGLMAAGIETNQLEHLKKHKPTILNLDDFEFFWQIADSANPIDQFGDSIKKWEESTAYKGKDHFLFLSFLSGNNKAVKVNSEFSKFFNFKSFMEGLSPES